MNRAKQIKLLVPVLIAIFFCTSSISRADDILVAAAASLTDVLKDVGKAYQAKGTNKILLTLGPSNFLARQIDEGAPADLFFSADLTQMDFLDKRGRLEPGTRKNLLSNQLVIIVSVDSKLKFASPKELLKPEVRKIALADPAAVPVGVYTGKYLADEGLWDQVKPKVVPVQDARATLASVESGNVEAGFVYKTDAAVSNKVKIVYEVPVERGPKITYPLALIKESREKEAARDFANYLGSPSAKAAFKKYGFVVLD
ncbi:MAG: molybdate ABC transporter substrate-binding protein [Candidatus Binatia bacterium]